MPLLKIFSSTAVNAKVGSKIAFNVPGNYKRLKGVLVSSSRKVELTLNMEKSGNIMQREEFAQREAGGELNDIGAHELDYELKGRRVLGVVRLVGANTPAAVTVFLEFSED